jgi:hypothetical protein
MQEIFSSREIAMGIWIGVFFLTLFILGVKSTNFRQSAFGVFRAGTNKYIILFFLIIVIYTLIWIRLSSTLPIWNWKYLKDIIFWVLFIGVPFCFNAVLVKKESYFIEILKSSLGFIIFIEFLIGTFTFNLVTELILVPSATLLVLLNTVASMDKTFKPVEKFLSFVQVILGFSVLYFSFKNAIHHYIEFKSIDLLITFSIPIIMTVIFLPLAYMFAIYSEYDLLFKLMKFRAPKEKKIRRKIKWEILKVCKLSLEKVHTFRKNYLAQFYTNMSEEELDAIIESARFSYKTVKL